MYNENAPASEASAFNLAFFGPPAPPAAPPPEPLMASIPGTAAMVKPLSITARILAYLQEGRSLTPLEALASFGCFRLADAIFRLKGKGWLIGTHLKTDPNGKTYARYSMLKIGDKITLPATDASYVRTVAGFCRPGTKDTTMVCMFSGLIVFPSEEIRLVA